jgi:solute carrier family 39 (zinc transporter), member 1/2/3
MDQINTLLPRDSCQTGNDYNGNLGVRISAIFVILAGAIFGSVAPVFANSLGGSKILSNVFFICKYFGSGVIIATAFIHLMSPASDALGDPCLDGPITMYPWVEGIMLMTVVIMFFVELMVLRYSKLGHRHSHSKHHGTILVQANPEDKQVNHEDKSQLAGEDHFGHIREYQDVEGARQMDQEEYAAQLTAIFILEFGIIFHSIFVGLTLAVSGDEFTTLYIVLVFHQTFEGLGLGSRLALLPWPKSKWLTPYLLGLGYAVSTPAAIAIGLGVRESYPPGGRTTLIVNGIFDSISAGILLYTGLVELLAHEFMFSPTMQNESTRTVMFAFFLLCLGAALMALLGKWA